VQPARTSPGRFRGEFPTLPVAVRQHWKLSDFCYSAIRRIGVGAGATIARSGDGKVCYYYPAYWGEGGGAALRRASSLQLSWNDRGGGALDRVAAAHLRLLEFLKALSGAVIFAVFLLIVSDVLIRTSGFKTWQPTSVLVEYGLLWFTMLAAPWLARNKAHVFIDAITQLLPGAVQQVLAKFVYLVCVIASVVVCYYSTRLMITAIVEDQIDIRAVDMPLWSLIAPIPLCFLLVAIEFLRFLLGYDSMYGSRSDVKEGA
jgi:TRAP-type C4-dicarboxylate transport system permease small subunit